MDYSATCDEKLPLWKSWAAQGKIQEAIDQLLALEKQTRTVSTVLIENCKSLILISNIKVVLT